MLTPGTSQDNIRGFFYRGNVNIGAGTREYSNGFVVDGVNNTWARDGRAAPELRDGLDPRVQGVDIHLQGRIRPRDRRAAHRRHEVRHQRAARLGSAVLPRQGADGADLLRAGEARTSAAISTAARSAVRSSATARISSAPTKAPTRTSSSRSTPAALWPQYDGTFPSDQDRWTYTAKVDHQIDADPDAVRRAMRRRTSTARSSPPAAARIRPTASTSRCRASRPSLGHTWMLSPRVLNDFRFQYALREVRSAPPYSHGSLGAGRLRRAIACRYCTPVFNYPSLAARRLRQQPDGPETRWQLKDDFSYLMHELGRHASVEDRASTSATSTFQADNLGSPLGTWTFPRDAAVRRQRLARPARRSIQHAADLRRHPGARTSPSICRTTGRSAAG